MTPWLTLERDTPCGLREYPHCVRQKVQINNKKENVLAFISPNVMHWQLIALIIRTAIHTSIPSGSQNYTIIELGNVKIQQLYRIVLQFSAGEDNVVSVF